VRRKAAKRTLSFDLTAEELYSSRKMTISQRERKHKLVSPCPQQQTKLQERLLHLTFRQIFFLL
jgi:hypothetical protein